MDPSLLVDPSVNDAARVHRSLFHPEDRKKEVNPALFQLKSFLSQPCVIMLIFNLLEGPPETLAGQQCPNFNRLRISRFDSFCLEKIRFEHGTTTVSSVVARHQFHLFVRET